jgi:hypothetical protein
MGGHERASSSSGVSRAGGSLLHGPEYLSGPGSVSSSRVWYSVNIRTVAVPSGLSYFISYQFA